MLDEYKQMTTEEKDQLFKKLPKSQKEDIEAYLEYRKSRGLNADSKLRDVRTDIIHLRHTAAKDLSKLTIKEIIKLVSIVKGSSYGDYSKNEIITNLKRYIKWKNPKISLEDIRLIKNPTSKKKISHSDLLNKEDIEKLIKHEPKMFWKAFLITQFEAGLRTKETRFLKWDDIKFDVDDDGISEIGIFSTKTKKSRTVFVREATFYLKKLKEEQINMDDIGEYIFHSKRNISSPVTRGNVSVWMQRLSKKALGRVCWNYLLRHSRGNELYQLTKEGKISKDIALLFMGHEQNMSKVYTHDESEKIKKMLKDQIYNIEELPPEQKKELQEKISQQDKKIEQMKSKLKENEVMLKRALDMINKAIEHIPDK